MPAVSLSSLLAYAPVILAALGVLLLLRRRGEMREYAQSHRQRTEAKQRGSDKARLQHPSIDLSQCFGCGACVRACPEDGVLSLLHGQAVVLHGARCVGHGLCASACPTGAIALTLGDLSDRRDLPAVDKDLEAVGVPGLFLAGELGGFALVRTAVSQGVAVADAIARRRQANHGGAAGLPEGAVELLIVGAGPGGIACSLRAKERGIHHLVIEQEERIGGTVAAYPRRKLVMTQTMELPLHGRLPRLTYEKEELVELWGSLVRDHALPVRTGVRLDEIRRDGEGLFEAVTSAGVIRARQVCLALGRRGSPRKLGVPGEELAKVSYSLLDAESYQNRRVLVVGGGDSAVEAALGLAEEAGNTVTISYRKSAFFRLKARNDKRLEKALQNGRLAVLFDSEVVRIEADRVLLKRLAPENGGEKPAAGSESIELMNDEVFIFAGGVPPFGVLEKAGVSFDPKDRPAEEVATAGGSLLPSLLMVLVCALAMLQWAQWHRDYYSLRPEARPAMETHAFLRPAGPLGLSFGVLATFLLILNLAYLWRRSRKWGSRLPGSLRAWMSSHVFTGLFSFLCVLTHAGFTFRDTVGGHAFIAMGIVVVTGVIGRYLYAFVPHAANGTEVDLDDLRGELTALSGQWDRSGRGFGDQVRQHIDDLLHTGRWRPGLFSRIWALVSGQFRLRAILHEMRRQGHREGIPADEVAMLVGMARRAYRLTLLVTHYEEVRAVLSSWRYFHRWLALLLVLLVAIHMGVAIRFADMSLPFGMASVGGRP